MNAVLVDLGSGTCPIEVYMRIQDYQNKEIIEKNPELLKKFQKAVNIILAEGK